LELSNYLHKNKEIRDKILDIVEKNKSYDSKTKIIKIKMNPRPSLDSAKKDSNFD
jgi:hypothetical protein